jgi:hypothetical protein
VSTRVGKHPTHVTDPSFSVASTSIKIGPGCSISYLGDIGYGMHIYYVRALNILPITALLQLLLPLSSLPLRLL